MSSYWIDISRHFTSKRCMKHWGGEVTVKKGALWYEENLPAESLLYGILGVDQPHDDSGLSDTGAAFTEHLGNDALIQIGGKATVGRGLVRFLV